MKIGDLLGSAHTIRRVVFTDSLDKGNISLQDSSGASQCTTLSKNTGRVQMSP